MRTSTLLQFGTGLGLAAALVASPPDSRAGERFDLSAVEALLARPEIGDVDGFLRALPPELKKSNRYTLGFETHGLLPSSPRYPNVFLFGERESSVVIAFNSDPARARESSETLEILDFDPSPADPKFRMAEVTFRPGARPSIEHHPRSCVQCHGENPRPLWTAGYEWPGFFNSIGSRELAELGVPAPFLKGALKQKAEAHFNPRLAMLEKIEYYGYNGYRNSPNIELTARLSAFQAMAVARRVFNHPLYPRSRNALLRALTLCEAKNPVETVRDRLEELGVPPESWFLNRELKRDRSVSALFLSYSSAFETGLGPIEFVILSHLLEWDPSITPAQEALFVPYPDVVSPERYRGAWDELRGKVDYLPRTVVGPSGRATVSEPSPEWCREFDERFPR